jgi:hypothetical protein
MTQHLVSVSGGKDSTAVYLLAMESGRPFRAVFADTGNERRSATFFPAVTDPTDVDRPGTYSRIRTLVEWSKTGRGGRQYDMFFAQQAGGGCASDLGLCDGADHG